MPPPSPNILVIRRRYVGDLVLLAPFLRSLRARWPEAGLTVLTDEGYGEVLGLNPDRPEVWEIPRRPPRLRRTLALWRRLRSARFTHVFDIDDNDRTALLARLTGARLRAGFAWAPGRVRRRLAYTHAVPVDAGRYAAQPIVEHYLSLLGPAEVPVATREVRLEPPAEARAAAAAWLERANPGGRPLLLLHPGSRSPFRLWPSDRFARVADRARRELNAAVVLVGGVRDLPRVREIAGLAATGPAVVDPPPSLAGLAALCARARAVLCHDSAPMHIAAAVGATVVALYGSQNAAVWAPPGSGHRLLQPPLPCGGACVAPESCDRGNSYKNYCVRRLGEDEVFAAVRDALA